MKSMLKPLAAHLGKGLLASTALFLMPLFSTHAVEMTAEETIQTGYDTTFNKAMDDTFQKLEDELDAIIAQRIQGDLDIRQDLNVAVANFKARLDTLESRINILDNRFTEIRTLLEEDIRLTRARILALETTLHGNLAYLSFRIDQTYGYINTTAAGLQTQVNSQRSQITSLYNEAARIDNSLNAIQNTITSLDAQLTALATCVANATCLPTRAVNTERHVVRIFTGEGAVPDGFRYETRCDFRFFGWCVTGEYEVAIQVYQYGTKPLGMYYPTWPYCAITSVENQDVRDFRIYLRGSEWTLRNETIADSGAGSQQEGYVEATCIRFY